MQGSDSKCLLPEGALLFCLIKKVGKKINRYRKMAKTFLQKAKCFVTRLTGSNIKTFFQAWNRFFTSGFFTLFFNKAETFIDIFF